MYVRALFGLDLFLDARFRDFFKPLMQRNGQKRHKTWMGGNVRVKAPPPPPPITP
jgi:hypothetical protein